MSTSLTHDRKTIPPVAYARVAAGLPMPGVFLVSDEMPISQAIDEVLIAVHACPRRNARISSGISQCDRRRGRRDEYRPLRPLLEELKRTREAAGLIVAEVSRRCGIDEPARSRRENVQQQESDHGLAGVQLAATIRLKTESRRMQSFTRGHKPAAQGKTS
jgi:hypothetical protein